VDLGRSRTQRWAGAETKGVTRALVGFFQAADCSMDSMRVEIMHVWNTAGKGSFLRECVVIKSSPIGHHFVIAA
jgi:hypothetical protein